MGFIRSALNIQTAGLVSDKSKKQRVAADTLRAIQGQSLLMVAQMPNLTPEQKYRAMLAQPGLSWGDRVHIKNCLKAEMARPATPETLAPVIFPTREGGQWKGQA
jgi:hypothetical protein